MTRARLAALVVGGVVLLVVAVAAGGLWLKEAGDFYKFDGVSGPPGQSLIAAAKPGRIADFDRGGPHRLAVLVTDPSSDWLGLARAFKAEGIPFTLTQDPQRALQHKVLLVYPMISGRLAPDTLRGLAEHVRAGGTVLGFDLEGGGIEPVFGIKGEQSSLARETLQWPGSAGPPEEQVTRIGRAGGEGALGSLAYEVTDAKVLARYEDGGVAITCRTEGGTACLMGVDLGEMARRAIDGRDEAAAREYVNQYEPSLDVLVRWVKDLYVAGEPMPWLLDTAPTGHDVTIVLTHDIDYTRSVVNSRAYADLERSAGIKATYFMQTKYVRDYNDDVFLTTQTVPLVKALQDDEGMEVASHTVAHSRVFKSFPLGDGHEHYPDYRPFVETATSAHGGTIFGETRVSKYLLERLSDIHVTSFRPGHLSYPFQLPEALQATGYQWSSSVTADSCLTHLPHQMTFSRAGSSLSPIYEFPVTIEDEEKPKLGDRFEAESAVIAKIAAHHGLVVILIHPDVLDHKFAFEQELIQRWKDRAWMPDLDEFGRWWRARDEADVDVVPQGAGWSLEVNAPEALQNLTVLLPKSRQGQLRLNGVSGHASLPLG